ncbi:MAG: 4Fe-4S binding protein [Candidatus Vecturithrix sp.]|nr:4Fe-4S binding protein [Candidatus Vecturithrix sp.]
MFSIDQELCTGCGKCIKACPANAITLQDAKVVINQSLCKQCGICADQCPVQAVAENVPAYKTQAGQQKSVFQSQTGIFSQVMNTAERWLKRGIRVRDFSSGQGRGGRGGRFGRGRSRGRR